MNLREQPRDRQPFAGEQRREKPTLDERAGGPLGGRVQVVPIELESRWAGPSGRVFSVEIEWIGPGLPELPPADGPVVARDVYVVGDNELARAIAAMAVDELRAGNVPELRKLALRFA